MLFCTMLLSWYFLQKIVQFCSIVIGSQFLSLCCPTLFYIVHFSGRTDLTKNIMCKSNQELLQNQEPGEKLNVLTGEKILDTTHLKNRP